MAEIKKCSAGIVVVRQADSGWRYLILRAYRNWDFPKGEIEPGEEPLHAALRETREETSLEQLEFRWGTDFVETEVYRGGKVARYYLAQTGREFLTLPINPALGWPEHHEYRWATFEEACALLPARLTPVLEWAHGRIGEFVEPRSKFGLE